MLPFMGAGDHDHVIEDDIRNDHHPMPLRVGAELSQLISGAQALDLRVILGLIARPPLLTVLGLLRGAELHRIEAIVTEILEVFAYFSKGPMEGVEDTPRRMSRRAGSAAAVAVFPRNPTTVRAVAASRELHYLRQVRLLGSRRSFRSWSAGGWAGALVRLARIEVVWRSTILGCANGKSPVRPVCLPFGLDLATQQQNVLELSTRPRPDVADEQAIRGCASGGLVQVQAWRSVKPPRSKLGALPDDGDRRRFGGDRAHGGRHEQP
mmetsp:Transcript_100839/g.289843  ORF Transcript_100839/g.289843 Transcript_100839/m.289843 type:complete len:266 (-) Transcript_100839:353-1150(-)